MTATILQKAQAALLSSSRLHVAKASLSALQLLAMLCWGLASR